MLPSAQIMFILLQFIPIFHGHCLYLSLPDFWWLKYILLFCSFSVYYSYQGEVRYKTITNRNDTLITPYMVLKIVIPQFFFFSFYSCTCGTWSSWAWSPMRAAAAGLCHSHSNARSKPHLWPMPQLEAMLDSWPIESGQGLNLHPHIRYVGFLKCWATTATPIPQFL